MLGLVAAGSAQATVNYLLITFPDGATAEANRLRLSVASSCPSNFYFHLYGAQDLQGWRFSFGWGGYYDYSVEGISSLVPGICVAGVPASVNTSLIYADPGSLTAPTPDATITLGGTAIDLTGYTMAANSGNWPSANVSLLIFPDSFTIAVGGGSGGGADSSYFSYGILGVQTTGYSNYAGYGYSTRRLANYPTVAGAYGWAALNTIGSGNLVAGAGMATMGKKHFYAIGY